MKKTISCFEEWWRPLVFALFIGSIFITSRSTNSDHFKNISLYLMVFAWAGLLASSIYQLSKQKWIRAIITGICFIGVLIGFLYYTMAMFLIDQSQPDRFADDLLIPNDILIESPIDVSNINSMGIYNRSKNSKTHISFILYNSFQPGLYKYDLWISTIEKGDVYLKAFEVTKNHKLSEISLKEGSRISIFNPSDTLMKFGIEKDFTIYEGDFGKPYAARFEVWFKPDNGKKERKLMEKNFKIEGWMR